MGTTIQDLGLRVKELKLSYIIPYNPIMENQMEKNDGHDMETGGIQGYKERKLRYNFPL